MPLKLQGRRPGAAMAMLAVAIVMLLGVAALAIEVGRLYAARGQAGRRADAAALAAVSAFISGSSVADSTSAVTAGTALAESNPLFPSFSVTDEIVPVRDSSLVNVTVRATAASTLAKFLGKDSVSVSATAKAGLGRSGSIPCLRPFALPDAWAGMVYGDTLTTQTYTPRVTSWGTTYRNAQADIGTQIQMTLAGSGEHNKKVPYGKFVKLTLPNTADPLDCIENVYTIQNTIPATSNQGQPTAALIALIIADDPGLHWDNATQQLVGSKYGDWRASPRVSPAVVFNPNAAPLRTGGNPSQVTPVGFIGMFWESTTGQGANQSYVVRLMHVRAVADGCEFDPDIECAPGLAVVQLKR